MTSSASICSVIRMMPISAAMAEPARPVTINAESTGPNSVIRLKGYRWPQICFGAQNASGVVPLQPQTIPAEKPGQGNHQEGACPNKLDSAA
jgi:hypothetical protein